jgi:hypothetical protein
MSNADMSSLHRNFERRAVPVLPAVAVPTTPQTVVVVDPRVDAILNRLNEQTQLIGRMAENFQKLISNVTVPQMPTKQDLVSGTFRLIEVREIALDTAMTDEKLVITGNILAATTDGVLAGIGVRVNSIQDPVIYLDEQNPIAVPFYQLYLTSPAQSGKTLRLVVGVDGMVNLSNAPQPIMDHFELLRLPSDLFTGALATNVIESENIPGLLCDKVRITGLTMRSSQNLNYRMYLYSNDRFSSDYKLMASIGLNLPASGYQIGATGYYFLDVQSLDIDYEDEDGTREIHASLENLSATSKTAETLLAVLAAYKNGGTTGSDAAPATDAASNDMSLLSSPLYLNDYYAIGNAAVFDKIILNQGIAGVGAWTLVWEYYNGSAWVELPGVIDGTDGFKNIGAALEVTFPIPADWATTTIATQTGYWVRARISGIGSLTTQAKGTQAWVTTRLLDLAFTYEPRK